MVEISKRITTEDHIDLKSIIDAARSVHEEHPYDAAHDWDHHAAVCINGLTIIQNENMEDNINIPVFVAAALFHDLERGSKEHRLAISKMKEVGFSDEFVAETVSLINQHSFKDKQTTLSGKILWAADKIEYVSKDRFIKSVSKLSPIELFGYKRLWRIRIKKVEQRFSEIENDLPSATRIFKDKFIELRSYLEESEPKYLDWLKGLNLEMI